MQDEGLFSVGRVIQVFNNHQVHIKHESLGMSGSSSCAAVEAPVARARGMSWHGSQRGFSQVFWTVKSQRQSSR